MTKKLHIATLGFYANEMVSYAVTKRGADKIALFYTEENVEHLEKVKRDFVDDRIPVLDCKVNPWVFEEWITSLNLMHHVVLE
ncbi:MAG: hypothetical protein ACXAEF_11980 [Candidatus Thorarchaeota archaeon]